MCAKIYYVNDAWDARIHVSQRELQFYLQMHVVRVGTQIFSKGVVSMRARGKV